jgi:hypothetical protein
LPYFLNNAADLKIFDIFSAWWEPKQKYESGSESDSATLGKYNIKKNAITNVENIHLEVGMYSP